MKEIIELIDVPILLGVILGVFFVPSFDVLRNTWL